MSRVKRATARGWDTTNKIREERDKPKEAEEKQITEEEHKARLNKLKGLGLI